MPDMHCLGERNRLMTLIRRKQTRAEALEGMTFVGFM